MNSPTLQPTATIAGRPSSSADPRSVVLTALALLLLYAALAFGIYNDLTRSAPGANDFYSRWMGARALFLHGQNPYSDEVTRDIQMGMYGRLARPDEDKVAFAYPLYAAYLAAPLVALPYSIAQALWMAFLVMGLVAGTLAFAVVNRIALSPFVLAMLIVGSLLFYPSVRGIFLGQYALVSFAFLALAILAISAEHQTWAGILLALSSSKPQPVVLLVPVILFWAWQNQRRGIVWSTLSALFLLIASSFILVPTWFVDFVNGLRSYAQYAPVGPPLETLFRLLLPGSIATVLFYFISGLLLLGACAMVYGQRAASWFEFQPVLGFVALVTTLIAGRIGTPDQVLLLVPWLAWFGFRGRQKKSWFVVAAVCVLLAAPWIVFIDLLQGNQEAIVVTTVLPLFTLAVLLGMTVSRLRRGRAA